MNDKIKRLAKNVTELLTNTETPQETYYSLIRVMRKQKDYFEHMSPENIVKLILYCYSYGQTNSFEESDKILNNIVISSFDKFLIFFARSLQFGTSLSNVSNMC